MNWIFRRLSSFVYESVYSWFFEDPSSTSNLAGSTQNLRAGNSNFTFPVKIENVMSHFDDMQEPFFTDYIPAAHTGRSIILAAMYKIDSYYWFKESESFRLMGLDAPEGCRIGAMRHATKAMLISNSYAGQPPIGIREAYHMSDTSWNWAYPPNFWS